MNTLARLRISCLCLTWMAALLSGCSSSGGKPADPAVVATPEAAASKAQALAVPPGLTDEAFNAWLHAERARIASARQALAQGFEAAEKACWRRFAVNDCLRRARQAQRADLADLRQQELALNAHERQRKTDARLRGLQPPQAPASAP